MPGELRGSDLENFVRDAATCPWRITELGQLTGQWSEKKGRSDSDFFFLAQVISIAFPFCFSVFLRTVSCVCFSFSTLFAVI
jgi:hypothetical protein